MNFSPVYALYAPKTVEGGQTISMRAVEKWARAFARLAKFTPSKYWSVLKTLSSSNLCTERYLLISLYGSASVIVIARGKSHRNGTNATNLIGIGDKPATASASPPP